MKPNRERIKTRLAIAHAGAIRRAIKDSVSVSAIMEAWGHAHPEVESPTIITPDAARTWAYLNVRFDNTKLMSALGRVYADAYILGENITTYEIARLMLNKAAPSPEARARSLVIPWDTWKPGNRAAAALVNPPGGLQKLLDRRGVVIKELNRTAVNRIGTALANGLTAGDTANRIARDIEDIVGDPVRALTIAQTEMTSAVVQASLDLYRDSGVEMVEWLVADPCDECRENLDQSPIPIGDQWINGDPPVHPNCMCDIAPAPIDFSGLENGVTPEGAPMPIDTNP